MRLDAFLLADAVSTPPDGKVYVHGGGLTRIMAPSLPFILPQLGVLARFEVDESELQAPHEFVISLTGPDGAYVIPPGHLRSEPVGALGPLPDGEEHYLQIALNFGSLPLASAGIYRFELHADDEPVKTMTIPVVSLQPEQ
jgi:hypothetical protein